MAPTVVEVGHEYRYRMLLSSHVFLLRLEKQLVKHPVVAGQDAAISSVRVSYPMLQGIPNLQGLLLLAVVSGLCLNTRNNHVPP
jgi:hypothetical protein